jgi:predicted MFS family arabinose efflux permease
MLVGLLALVLSPGPVVSLPALLFMSLAGTLSLAALQTAMGSIFGEFRSKGILEANLTASVFSMVVPLVLLGGTAMGLGWRVVFPAALLALVLIAVLGLPATKKHAAKLVMPEGDGSGKLGRAFWLMWLVIFFGVSVEWAVAFWCMTYLLTLPGHSMELATAGTVLLGFAGVVGRFATSRISHRFREETLVFASIALVAVGFLPYWALPNVPLAFLGLFACGYGTATFFPLVFSLTVSRAPGNPSRAASMVPVASGLGIGLAPLVLGWLADQYDLKTALWYIPVGLLVMATLLVFAIVPLAKRPGGRGNVPPLSDAQNNGGDGAAHEGHHSKQEPSRG